MNNTELNKYILHYLKEDRTKSAIMLTSGWGTGKSFYIQNDLIPFLKENGNYQCIVVSLYGLQDIMEISKSLYFEARFNLLSSKTETVETSKFLAKTVAKGITSFFGIDLSKSEEELRSLYESIDLAGRLIILEDIERSGIDVLSVLGYVNNLVEQDGVKVLLVANEDEMLKYNIKADEDGKAYKVPDQHTSFYLNTKEKTISDTILYHGDLKIALKDIVLQFEKEWLKRFLSEDDLKEIIDLMHMRRNYNLRTFTFACQKVVDIFEKLSIQEDDFIRTIFFSIISFSMTIKRGNLPEWDSTGLISAKLGTSKYPLYRICYEYIRWQEFDADKIEETIEAHKKMRLYDNNVMIANDSDLKILYNYFKYSEKDVLAALINIESRLANPEDIPLYSYINLAYYLIVCRSILDFDYSSCKERMICNLRNYGADIDSGVLLLNHFIFENSNELKDFTDFSNAIEDALNDSTKNLDFSYSPEDIIPFFNEQVLKNETRLTSGHAFISKFDLEKLYKMVFCCNPSQLDCFRGILHTIYRGAGKQNFLEADVLFIKELSSKIQNVLPQKSKDMDKMVRYQIKCLINNLQNIIEQLS